MQNKLKHLSIAQFGCHLPKLSSSETDSYPVEIIKKLEGRFSHQILIWSNIYDFSNKELALFPNLTYFINWGTNDANIKNEEALKRKGIVIKKIDTYCMETLPEYIVMLILAYARRFDRLETGQKYVGNEIYHKVVGIIGLGKIGFRTGQILHKAFQVNILYYSRFNKNVPDFQFVTLQEMFKICDYIVITAKGKEFTLDLSIIKEINKDLVIVNIMNDYVLSYKTVRHYCSTERIKGYIGDVKITAEEKKGAINYPNVWIINHLGYLTQEAKEIKGNTLIYYLKGIMGTADIENHYAYILRHGKTIWNKEKKFQGSHDSRLTEEGTAHAEKLGDFIKKTEVKYIYTSPQGRAIKTATIIAKKAKVEIIVVPELQEMNFGIFEGKRQQVLKEIFNDYFAARERNPWYKLYIPYPEGESYFDVYIRLLKKISWILRTNDSFVIVGHESVNRIIRGIIRGMRLEDMILLRQKNHEVISINLDTAEERIQQI